MNSMSCFLKQILQKKLNVQFLIHLITNIYTSNILEEIKCKEK